LQFLTALLKNKELQTEISAENSMMGDEYAEAFAHTLQFKDSEYHLNLRNTRISQKGADMIIENMGSNVKKINFSYNPQVKNINTNFLFRIQRVCLIELNIEGNKVGDGLVAKL